MNFVKFLGTPFLQNTFFTEHLWTTASDNREIHLREGIERKAMETLITRIIWYRYITILVVIRLDIIENWISILKKFLKNFRFSEELK